MINFTRAKTKSIEEATEGDILYLGNEYWLICHSKDKNDLREYYFKGLTNPNCTLLYPCSLGRAGLPAILKSYDTKNKVVYDGSSSTVNLDEE